MADFLKSLTDGMKGNPDYMAFALILAVSAYLLNGGTGIGSVLAFMIVAAVVWIISRYALLQIQSREKLRDMQVHAKEDAKAQLEKHSSGGDMLELARLTGENRNV